MIICFQVNLSHNKFSTLTRHTFPSNIYVPYNLQKIDLSYNIMSYLPVDLKYGTAKLKELNLSHNQLNGLNAHVLANLTQLDVLDMSYNDLSDEKRFLRFRVSENLTELDLSGNNLNYLPVDKLGSRLRKLKLEGNYLEAIEENIQEKILNNGLEPDYLGNPINCDCHVRPLRRFADQFGQVPEFLKSIVCSSPTSTEGQLLIDVEETLLICQNEVEAGKQLEINPDIKYRKVLS